MIYNKSTESWQCYSLTIQYLLQLIKALRTRIHLTFDDPSRESLDLGILALLCKVIKLHGRQKQWNMWCCKIGCWCVLTPYLTVCFKRIQPRSYSSRLGTLQLQPCNYVCLCKSDDLDASCLYNRCHSSPCGSHLDSTLHTGSLSLLVIQKPPSVHGNVSTRMHHTFWLRHHSSALLAVLPDLMIVL